MDNHQAPAHVLIPYTDPPQVIDHGYGESGTLLI